MSTNLTALRPSIVVAEWSGCSAHVAHSPPRLQDCEREGRPEEERHGLVKRRCHRPQWCRSGCGRPVFHRAASLAMLLSRQRGTASRSLGQASCWILRASALRARLRLMCFFHSNHLCPTTQCGAVGSAAMHALAIMRHNGGDAEESNPELLARAASGARCRGMLPRRHPPSAARRTSSSRQSSCTCGSSS